MESNGLKFKNYFGKLRDIVKAKYKQSVLSLVSYIVIALAVALIVLYAGYVAFAYLAQKLVMLMYATMYGMSGAVTVSSIAISAVLFILALIVLFVVIYIIQFFAIAIRFEFQDAIKDETKSISLKGIWRQFRSMNKNQMLRLILWQAWFIFWWELPTTILAMIFSSNTILLVIFRIATTLIIYWKGLEYSQAAFLYREKRPSFLGQSMRHALTASRRFMHKKKWQLLGYTLTLVIPFAIVEVLFGLITYYGDYTATGFFIYLGIILIIVGFCAYLPVMFFFAPLFYETAKPSVSIDETFEKTFKSVEFINGDRVKAKK